MRHTFATNALAYGMDIKTLSTILGHVSCATTLNTYSHVTDEMRQKAAVKIDKGIAKAEVTEQEGQPKERTMTTFQARKRWSRKAGPPGERNPPAGQFSLSVGKYVVKRCSDWKRSRNLCWE